MDVDAQMRRRVHARFEELMGQEMADAVMDMFPPAGWRGVATVDDVERVAAELRGDVAELRGEMSGQIAQVRGEIAEVRGDVAELRGEMSGQIAQVRGEIAEVRGEIAEVKGGMGAMVVRIYMANLLSMIGVAGLVLAAVRFG